MTTTVAELIARLQECNPTDEVYLSGDWGGNGYMDVSSETDSIMDNGDLVFKPVEWTDPECCVWVSDPAHFGGTRWAHDRIIKTWGHAEHMPRTREQYDEEHKK